MRLLESVALSFLLAAGVAKAEQECPEIPLPILHAVSLKLQAMSQETGDYNAVKEAGHLGKDACWGSHLEQAPEPGVTGLQWSFFVTSEKPAYLYGAFEIEAFNNSSYGAPLVAFHGEKNAEHQGAKPIEITAISGIAVRVTPDFQVFTDFGFQAEGADVVVPQVQWTVTLDY